MKSRFLQALILIICGLLIGYVWSDHILTFMRSVLPSSGHWPDYHTLTYDGWLT